MSGRMLAIGSCAGGAKNSSNSHPCAKLSRVSANEQSLPQFNPPIDISAGYTNTTKGTDYASLVRAAAKKHKLPDDVADDYLQVTGKIESGNQHYDKSGKVKESYAGALGGGQLTPDKPGGRTKRVVDQVYDLSDPAQNAEAGVRYFNSFGDDPVARRIGYFGGDGPALKHYRQTGRIPTGGDKYTTFQQYVDRTMGGKHKAVPDISAGFVAQGLPTFNAPDNAAQPAQVPAAKTLTATPAPLSSDSSGKSRPTTVAPPVPTSSPLIESRTPVAAANGQTSQLPTFTRSRSVVAQDQERLNRGDDFAPPPSGYAAEQAKGSAIDQWSNRELSQQQALEHAAGVRRRKAQQQIAKRNAMVENLRVSMLTEAIGTAAHAENEASRDKILNDVKNASTADVMKWARGTGTRPAGSFKFVGAENKDGSFSFHPQTIADRLSQPAPKNANDIEAQTKDSIRAQILSERAAAEKGSVEGQEFAMARGASEPANAVETEVNRRYQSQQEASQERIRLFQALTPAEKDQWTNGFGKQASDILQSPLPGVASAMKEFRAKATRLSAGIVDLVSKIPGDTATERRIADDLRLRAQQLEDATQVAESNAPLNFKQQALKQVYGLVGGLVLNSPAMLNPVAGFAAMNVLEASGENKPWSERLRRGAQGAAIGGVFEGAGLIPTEGTAGVDQLRQIATQSAAIGAGTFGVETAFGAHPVDALKLAAVNMGLHGIFKAPELLSAGADVGMRSEALPENVRSALARTQGREPVIAQRQGSDEYASVFVDPEVAKQESALNRKAEALAREGDEAGLAEVRSQLDKLRDQHIVTPLTPDEAADRMRGIDEGNRRAVSMPATDYDRMMERAGKKPLPQREVSATPAARQGLLPSGEEPAAPPTSPLQPRAPEAPEAIQAQVDALVEGRGGRKAVIIPRGGDIPPGNMLPKGYALYSYRGQSVVYNPKVLNTKTIKDAIDNKRTSDLTGAVEQEGPGTTSVVTARKDGKEQETVYVSPEKVDQQVAETQAQHPDAEIEVGGREQVEKVIGDRMSEAPVTIHGYHGSQAKGLTELKPSAAQQWGEGVYFATKPEAPTEEFGAGGQVYEADITLKRPYHDMPDNFKKLDLESTKAWDDKWSKKFDDVEDAWSEDANFANAALRELGYDGVIADHGEYGQEVVPFDKSAIKMVEKKSPATTSDYQQRYAAARDRLQSGESLTEADYNEFPGLRKLKDKAAKKTSEGTVVSGATIPLEELATSELRSRVRAGGANATQYRKELNKRETNRNLAQFVEDQGGINVTDKDSFKGELATISKKESGSKYNLFNDENMSGDQRFGVEYMMDAANVEGYRDSDGQPFSAIGDFIDAIASDLTPGVRTRYTRMGEFDDTDFEDDYYRYAQEQGNQSIADQYAESADGLISMMENDASADLLDKIHSGAMEKGDVEKFRRLAESYGVRPQDIKAIVERGKAVQAGEVETSGLSDVTRGSKETKPAEENLSDTSGNETNPSDTVKSIDSEVRDYGTPERPNVPTLSEAFRDHFNQGEGFKSIVEARKFAGDLLGGQIELGTKAVKAIDEAVELGAVRAAREIVAKDKSAQAKFNELVALNARMPTLGTKTSSSVKNQAYSTPLPLAYIASRLSSIDDTKTVGEPTAGNGALLIEADPEKVTANEKDRDRFLNLESLLPSATITQRDATEIPLAGGAKSKDVIIANPPFGVVTEGGASKKFRVNEQYTTTEIDHAIALKALEAMKDDGSAVLIVGGINATDTEARAKGYQGIAKRRFYSTLYDGYNVVDHFTVNGDLYKKQGAAWPVDVVVIRGRGKSARALPAADVPRIINTWDELGGILNESPSQLLDADKSSTAEGRRDQGDAGADAGQGGLFQPTGRPGLGDAIESAGNERIHTSGTGRNVQPLVAEGSTGFAAADLAGQRSASGKDLQGNRPGELGVGADGPPSRPRPVTREALGATQSSYRPSSGATGLSTLVPVNMKASIENSLDDVTARRGNVDQFIGKELGYDPDTIGKYFSAEQVDALALALDNMMRGSGFIIGDQGGIGKGRVVAGVIRWALRNGKIPIFVTEKPNLYKDIVRDLVDIGEGKIADWARRALMTNSGEKVYLDDNQEIPLRSGDSASHKKKLQDHINDDSLGQHEAIFTTYNQMQTVKGVRTIRQDFLQHFGNGAVMILDESHNAGGAEKKQKPGEQILDRALFARQLIQNASAVFYSSATYAKRPQVMDLYSKTDMAKAVDDPSKLAEAIAKGGVPLQQVVAAMLSEAGQYIRRERDFAGMSYETQEIPVDHEMAESTSAVMRSIAAFDQVKQAIVSKLDKEARKEAKAIAGESGATGNAGATSTNFTSLMHNLVGQMLLMLKADGTVKKALEVLNAGEKPVITLSNTMGSFIKNYVEDFGLNPGDALNLSFGDMLRRYLERSRDVVVGKAFGPKERHHLTDAELGEAGVRSYKQALDLIHKTDWTSLPVSPIDYIKNALLKKGYKTGEITGRQHVIDYSVGQVYRTRPGREISIAGRSKTLVDFNFGRLDGLIINQAGSTGLSIHASEKFRDQKKRHMLIAQPELNIDTHMQMLYRVDRTGQVVKPSYSQLTADIPAEKRPAAILSKKMASLNANTTAAKGSAYEAKNVPDFMNDYGDDIVASILEDDPELHAKLGSPPALKPNQKGNGLEREGAIRKVTGRIALLPLAEQEAFYQRIESEYDDLISRLDAMGENGLEAKTLNLDAKSLSRRPVFPSKGPSPFEQPAYAEVMDVKKIGKPYTTDQVMTQLRGALQFTETATIHQVEVAGEQRADLVLKDQNAKFNDYLHSIVDEIEDIDRARAKEAQLQGAIDRWRTLVQDFPVGRSVQLYTPAGQVYGIVTKVEQKGKPKNSIALGTWRITFAVADAMRTVTMPMSKINVPGLEDADAENEYFVRGYRVEQARLATVHDREQKKVVTVPVIEAFDRGQTESREDRTIMTGNILAAFGKFSKGRIINFTDEQGAVRQGIMMPTDFNLESELEAKPAKFSNAHQVQQFLEEEPNKRIVENDQKTLQLNWTTNGMLRVSTASSKAVGGQFYLNEQILNAAGDREFVKSGQRMQLTVYARDAPAVIHAIIGEGIHLQTDTHKKEARQVTGEADPGLFSVKREGQAGAVNIGAIFGPVINKLFPHLQEPAKQFSFIDSFSTRFIRGGSQMKRMGEDVYKQFAKAAGSRSSAAVINITAKTQIIKAFKGNDKKYDEFLAAGEESRLRGVRERWDDLSQDMQSLPDSDVKNAYEKGMRNVVQRIADHPIFDAEKDVLGPLIDYTDSMLAAVQFRPLKDFMSMMFEQARDNVATIDWNGDPDWFDDFTVTPEFQDALGVYKRLVEKPVSESHQENDGIFSTALGPLNTYFSLVPVQKDGSMLRKTATGAYKPYKRPENVHNRMATGLSERYDLTAGNLAETISKALAINNKATLLKALEDEGLLIPLRKNQAWNKTLAYKGVEYKADLVAVKDPRTLYKDGKVINIPGKMAVIPSFIRREIKPILEGDFTDGDGNALIKAINMIGMVGPLDAAFHSANVIGAVVAGTPFAGTDILSKTVGNTPATKLIASLINILRTDPLDEQGLKDLHEMSKLGVLPDRYASVTFSRAFARQTGAKWRPVSFSPLLFGPAGLDVRARLLMFRIVQSIDPHATTNDKVEFLGQLGIYNKAMQSEVERFLKKWGISPFYTAGSTMLRNGVRIWTGGSKIPDAGKSAGTRVAYRLAQQLSAGALGLIALWIVTHKLYTGKYPWQDPDSRFLQIKLKKEHRNSGLGKAMFGHNDKPGYVGLGFLSPMVDRGATALGITGAYETTMAGGSPGQIYERGERDIANSLLHPIVSGPAARGAFVMATGSEPYLSQTRDPYGQFGPHLLPAIGKTKPGLPTVYARAREGMLSWSSFNQKFSAELFGIGHVAEENEKQDKGGLYLRMMMDLAVPRLIKGTYNRDATAKRLEKERKTEDPNIVNQLKAKDVKAAADLYRHASDEDKAKLLQPMLRKVQIARPGAIDEDTRAALKEAGLDNALQTSEKRRPVEKEMQDLGLKFPQVERRIQVGANSKYLSDDEYDHYQQRANDLFYDRIPKAIASDDYKSAERAERASIIKKVESNARALATAEMRAQLAPKDVKIRGELMREQVRDRVLGANVKLMRLRDQSREKKLEVQHPNSP